MFDPSSNTVFKHFGNLKDPRRQYSVHHNFIEMIFIAVCAILAGANTFTEIEAFGNAKIDWFRKFCALPNGIPSHDTFRQLFRAISPKELERCFRSWVSSIVHILPGEVVNIDGKSARGSRASRKLLGALHFVSAWAVANGLSLGQVKVSDKSNEITAIPEILDSLMLEGCIITIDAMGCQTEIASKIREKGADYVLSLKGNQGTSSDTVKELFEQAEESSNSIKTMTSQQTDDDDHDRIEKRTISVLRVPEGIQALDRWTDLKSIVRIISERTIKGVTTIENRYYLSSLKSGAEHHGEVIRSHWHIENKLHWVLDVGFGEDRCQVRDRIAAENLAIVRRLTLGVLRQDKKLKGGIEAKRKQLGWNEAEIERLLELNPS